MRKLEPHETPRVGDWSYHFGYGWIYLTPNPKPILRMTIQQLEADNPRPHFPYVVVRPNFLERIFHIQPKIKPNQHRIRKTGSAF